MRQLRGAPFTILIRDASGLTRPAGPNQELNRDDTLIFSSNLPDNFYWGFALTQKDNPTPLLNLGVPEIYRQPTEINLPETIQGEVVLWLVLSEGPYSTEKILFDGFQLRSQNRKIQIFDFSAIFLK